jgi:bacteriorhodopsin
MFILLRIIRSLFGVIFASKILQALVELWKIIDRSGEADIDPGKYIAFLLLDVIIIAVSGFIFSWLRKIINQLHEKRFGEPHPKLCDKKWNL